MTCAAKKKTDVVGRQSDPSLLLRLGINRLQTGSPTPCNLCGSPWHPASGSEEPGGRRLCGACVRSLLRCLHEQASPRRTVRGYRFYSYAYPPPPSADVEQALRAEGVPSVAEDDPADVGVQVVDRHDDAGSAGERPDLVTPADP